MIVTKIEAVTKTRYRVYLDDEFAFVLYKGELSRYHIVDGCKLEEDLYKEIKIEVVLKRAKLRALHLLNDMGRTEAQLYQKLKAGGYPEDIVEAAIQYVKSFGYINDEYYAKNFIDSRKSKKSKKEIYVQLVQKGVSKEIIELAMEDSYEQEDSRQAIEELLRKKRYDPAHTDLKETQKILSYLTRKGFRYEDIRQVMQVSEWNA